MQIQNIEGIILKITPINDFDCIITIFSKEGLCDFFVKNSLSIKSKLRIASIPLTHVELIYTVNSKGVLHKVVDASSINSFIELRDTLESMMAAGTLVSSILKSQLLGKPAPLLYNLFIKCMIAIMCKPISKDLLTCMFKLKILQHDGLIDVRREPLNKDVFLKTNTLKKPYKCYCYNNDIMAHILLSEEENYIISSLLFCKNFQSLEHLHLIDITRFTPKINDLFYKIITE